ncbi:MAG: HAMP domain-containing protein [Verrucomicrobia bacterium]|nr:HAMP domain-containing protein [Verrucomicrobiota bacterium]
MKYRTKLYLGFFSVAGISTIIALGVVYGEVQDYIFHEMQSKVLSVAATTAANIDPELLKQIKSREDENKDAYKVLVEQLRKSRNANRRSDVYIKNMYTLTLSPKDPSALIYAVDAEENPPDISHAGDPDPDPEDTPIAMHPKERFSPDEFDYDRWGVWLSGYAPVLDKDGKYVATVGADMRASDFFAQSHMILLFEIPGLLASFLIAFISASILSRQASSALSKITATVKEIEKGNLNKQLDLQTNDEFSDVAQAINDMEKGLRERERLKTSFARYVSKQVFEKIMRSPAATKLEGERKKITVLFADIRHFTHLAEQLSPEQVVALLNEYFEQMLEAIFSHGGTLDKFIGDGLMAEFGAPLDDPLQEKNAVLTAIAMQKSVKKLSEKWLKEGKPSLEIGIGIHTGAAVVGNIGSEQRMEYTAIGDTVNIASRLQAATKDIHTQILISESTYSALKGEFPGEKVGPLALTGRAGEVIAYSLKL